MTSEMAETTTIREALEMYVRSLKPDGKPKAKSPTKSGSADKPVDLNALQDFLRSFEHRSALSELTPKEIGAYADKINGTGTTPQAAERLQAVKDFLAYSNKTAKLTDENLARYVRIKKPRNRKGVAVISNGAQPIELTSEGHAQLQAERDKLAAEIEVLARDIHKARADGDVTENSPLDAAREEHAHKEARVQVIRATLEKAVIIDQSQTRESEIVKIGAQVVVEENGAKTTYTLVNSTEAKPLEGRISSDSLVGSALLDKTLNDQVEVQTPGGVKRYKIVSIS